MKPEKLYKDSKRGLLWHPNWPEPPKPIEGDVGNLVYFTLYRQYSHDHKKALSEALKVANEEEVLDFVVSGEWDPIVPNSWIELPEGTTFSAVDRSPMQVFIHLPKESSKPELDELLHPQDFKKIISMLKQDEDEGYRFNNGECQKTCNCVKIHELKHGEESLKRGYQCLKPFPKAEPLMKSEPNNIAHSYTEGASVPTSEGMETPKERGLIAKILRDNITFAGQIGDYVIHGAIDKIIEHFSSLREQNTELETKLANLTQRYDAAKKLMTEYHQEKEKAEAQVKRLEEEKDDFAVGFTKWAFLELAKGSFLTDKEHLEKYKEAIQKHTKPENP